MNLSVTDDAGATTHFSLRYFRMAGNGGTTGDPDTSPHDPVAAVDANQAVGSALADATSIIERAAMDLTVGMATYRDFDGVYFTIQALRLYQDMEGVELLVVDNFGCEATRGLRRGGRRRTIRAGSSHRGHVSAPRPRLSRGPERGGPVSRQPRPSWREAFSLGSSTYYREHPVCSRPAARARW